MSDKDSRIQELELRAKFLEETVALLNQEPRPEIVKLREEIIKLRNSKDTDKELKRLIFEASTELTSDCIITIEAHSAGYVKVCYINDNNERYTARSSSLEQNIRDCIKKFKEELANGKATRTTD